MWQQLPTDRAVPCRAPPVGTPISGADRGFEVSIAWRLLWIGLLVERAGGASWLAVAGGRWVMHNHRAEVFSLRFDRFRFVVWGPLATHVLVYYFMAREEVQVNQQQQPPTKPFC